MMIALFMFVLLAWSAHSLANMHFPGAGNAVDTKAASCGETSMVKEYAKLSTLHGFVQGSRVPITDLHRVVIAVNQAKLDELKTLVDDISNPHSSNYGKHLSRVELDAFTSAPISSQNVLQFLEDEQITIITRGRNDHYITAEASIAKWEEILCAEFYFFQLPKGGFVKRALQYSIPPSLHDHVTAIFHVVDFPSLASDKLVRARSPVASSGSDVAAVLPTCGGLSNYICPAVLNSIYNMQSNTGNSLTSQAVFASLGEIMSPSDLTYFQEVFDLPVEEIAADYGGHVEDDACTVNGGNHCNEANLDIQYLMGMSQGVPTTYYYYGDEDGVIDWVSFIAEIADMPFPPLVITISYSSYEEPISSATLDAFNAEALKCASLGITILAASGDDGATGFLGRPDYGATCQYGPQFPASSPYVTAVGGTQNIEKGDPEIACQSQLGGVITSGGGFSAYYPTPSWQQAQVDTYFSMVSPYPGYNPSGRGYPDVSLVAVKYLVAHNGAIYTNDAAYGTSASTPVFAAMVSQVNAARFASGKSSLGWINPVLYEYAYSFILNDIISGNNSCVAQDTLCCDESFECAPGWDPVTGLGSIDYTAFLNTFLAIADPTLNPTIAPTLSPIPGPTLNPTIEPTARPSVHVTDMPTSRPSVGSNSAVKFSVVQVINGIDAATYNSDVSLYSGTLAKSIAMCMDGMLSSNVVDLTVQDVTTSRVPQLRSFSEHDAALTSAISTTYTVVTSESSFTYDELSSELKSSVAAGDFDTYLHENAAASGATGFSSATSTSVTTTNLQSGSSDNGGLSGGAIAGIVIACVVLLSACAYFVHRWRSSSPPLAAAEIQATTAGDISLNPVTAPKL